MELVQRVRKPAERVMFRAGVVVALVIMLSGAFVPVAVTAILLS